MNRYQLAKLVDWAGRIESRKRLQKVVYLLQMAGCPLAAEFVLHQYGPYSQELARLLDEMVREQLILEAVDRRGTGELFSYHLPTATQALLESLEASPAGAAMCAELIPYAELARRLLVTDLAELEHAATVVYFHRHGATWDAAVAKANRFKRSPIAAQAEVLAAAIVA